MIIDFRDFRYPLPFLYYKTELEFLKSLWWLGTEKATYNGGIDSLESIPGLLISLKIRALAPARPEPVFVDLLWSPGIDSQPGGPARQLYLSYRPSRLHRLAESVPRNRFLGSINVYKYGLRSPWVMWKTNFCFQRVIHNFHRLNGANAYKSGRTTTFPGCWWTSWGQILSPWLGDISSRLHKDARLHWLGV